MRSGSDTNEQLLLDVVRVHNGFSRDDRRNWIHFRDGLNNIESSQWRGAIEVVLNDRGCM